MKRSRSYREREVRNKHGELCEMNCGKLATEVKNPITGEALYCFGCYWVKNYYWKKKGPTAADQWRKVAEFRAQRMAIICGVAKQKRVVVPITAARRRRTA